VNEQSKQRWNAAGIQWRNKRKESDSWDQEKTSASQQSPKNWNARESDLFTPGLCNANVVQFCEKNTRGQEHSRRDCQHTHNTRNVPSD